MRLRPGGTSGGAHDALPDPLVGWGRGYPRRLGRLDSRTFGARQSATPVVFLTNRTLMNTETTCYCRVLLINKKISAIPRYAAPTSVSRNTKISERRLLIVHGRRHFATIFTARRTQCKARYCYHKSSVCPSVTLTYHGRICWVSSKVITRIISYMYRVFVPRSRNISNLVQGKQPQNWGGTGVRCCFRQKTCYISETGQDRTKVTIDDL